MAYKALDIKLLWYKAGGRCAICKKELSFRENITGHMAHIVAKASKGPRGDACFPRGKLNRYENLILLCPNHHLEVDTAKKKWSIIKLKELKTRHEKWVGRALSWHDPLITQDAFNKHLLILAGPSGVGKDVIINRIQSLLERDGRPVTNLRRYTTRSRRPGEIRGKPFVYLSPETFGKRVQSGRISCVHTSFGHTYGCDSHFSKEAPSNAAILYSMRNLQFLGDIEDRATARGVRVSNILIKADEDTLRARILQRTAPPEEKEIRIASTGNDIKWIRRNRAKVKRMFGITVENSDSHSLREATNEIYEFIIKTLDSHDCV